MCLCVSVVHLAALGFAAAVEQIKLEAEFANPHMTLSEKGQLSELARQRYLKVTLTLLTAQTADAYARAQAEPDTGAKELAAKRELFHRENHLDEALAFRLVVQNHTAAFSVLQWDDLARSLKLYEAGGKVLRPWFYDRTLTEPFTDAIEGRVFFRKYDQQGQPVLSPRSQWLRMEIYDLVPAPSLGPYAGLPQFELVMDLPDQVRRGLYAIPRPASSEELVAKALVLTRQGFHALAADYLERAVALSPDQLMPHLLLVEAWEKAGAWEQAETKLRKLQATFGESALLAFHQGRFYQNRGRCEDAVLRFERAVELFPHYREAMEGIVACHTALGQYGEADRWRDRLEQLSDAPPD